VSVPCPRCGRDYDVALFQFGRTIDCTCGSRVGLEPRVRRLPSGGEIRFIADAMLGRLARWLRTLGCDTAFDDEISDAELARRGIEEERAILTRDRRFREQWRVPSVLVLESQAPLEQLVEVPSLAVGDLDRHLLVDPGVTGQEDGTETAGSEIGEDLIFSDRLSQQEHGARGV